MNKNCVWCKKVIKKDLYSNCNKDYHWDCYILFFNNAIDEYQKAHHPRHTYEEEYEEGEEE
jgi:hypothetical protein